MSEPGALHLHRATVRPEWMDYNGHMSEAYYVLIFGEATDAFYAHIGLGPDMRARELVSVYTMEAHIRYLIEAHAGADVRIGTRVAWHDARRLRLRHDMRRESDGEVLALTELSLLHIDKSAMRAVDFHPSVLTRIAAIAHEQASVPPGEACMSRHWQRT